MSDWSNIDRRTLGLIKAKCRQVFSWSWEKRDFLNSVQFTAELDGKERLCVFCRSCGVVMPKSGRDYNVDHIVAIGSCSPEMVKLLFDKKNLQVLCKSCHDEKTLGDTRRIRDRALL